MALVVVRCSIMAPPVWARLANMVVRASLDYGQALPYDLRHIVGQEESLFFRDTKFLTKKEKNGEKLFRSRGNGWVFGSLALMIPELPEDWSGRDFYITLYKEMAVKLKEVQRADGTWSAGMLGSVEDYESIETSGTSFFAFGLAWGIINGYLDNRLRTGITQGVGRSRGGSRMEC